MPQECHKYSREEIEKMLKMDYTSDKIDLEIARDYALIIRRLLDERYVMKNKLESAIAESDKDVQGVLGPSGLGRIALIAINQTLRTVLNELFNK